MLPSPRACLQAKLQLGSEAPSATANVQLPAEPLKQRNLITKCTPSAGLTTGGRIHHYTSNTIRDPLKFPSIFVVAYGELAGHSSLQLPTISRHFCNTNTPRAYTQRYELQSPSPAFSCAGPRKREHRTKNSFKPGCQLFAERHRGGFCCILPSHRTCDRSMHLRPILQFNGHSLMAQLH